MPTTLPEITEEPTHTSYLSQFEIQTQIPTTPINEIPTVTKTPVMKKTQSPIEQLNYPIKVPYQLPLPYPIQTPSKNPLPTLPTQPKQKYTKNPRKMYRSEPKPVPPNPTFNDKQYYTTEGSDNVSKHSLPYHRLPVHFDSELPTRLKQYRKSDDVPNATQKSYVAKFYPKKNMSRCEEKNIIPKEQCYQRQFQESSILATPQKQYDKTIPYNQLIEEKAFDLRPTNSIIRSYTNSLDRENLSKFYSDQIRPFNDIDQKLSMTGVETESAYNDRYDNAYFDTWKEEIVEQNKKIDDIVKNINKECKPYKNINECMSRCSSNKLCQGFYLPEGNEKTCCPIIQPDFNTNRHEYDVLPDNVFYQAYDKFNKNLKGKKNVFKFYDIDKDNASYTVDYPIEKCLKECPKCIIGKCPENYRCKNIRIDPKQNSQCIITNEDRYNEEKNLLFDGPNIESLDRKYDINFNSGFDV
jgi:hypothetical protein